MKKFGLPCLLGFEKFLRSAEVPARCLFDHMLAGKCQTSSCQTHSGGAVPALRGAPTCDQRGWVFSLPPPSSLIGLRDPPSNISQTRVNMDVQQISDKVQTLSEIPTPREIGRDLSKISPPVTGRKVLVSSRDFFGFYHPHPLHTRSNGRSEEHRTATPCPGNRTRKRLVHSG